MHYIVLDPLCSDQTLLASNTSQKVMQYMIALQQNEIILEFSFLLFKFKYSECDNWELYVIFSKSIASGTITYSRKANKSMHHAKSKKVTLNLIF